MWTYKIASSSKGPTAKRLSLQVSGQTPESPSDIDEPVLNFFVLLYLQTPLQSCIKAVNWELSRGLGHLGHLGYLGVENKQVFVEEAFEREYPEESY